MSKEDLMKERFKVIADYPNSRYSVGSIHLGDGINPEFFRQYPHLFKELEWWEEREETSPMPMYLKSKWSNKIYEVETYCKGGVSMFYYLNQDGVRKLELTKNCEPSTESDYLKFKQP